MDVGKQGEGGRKHGHFYNVPKKRKLNIIC